MPPRRINFSRLTPAALPLGGPLLGLALLGGGVALLVATRWTWTGAICIATAACLLIGLGGYFLSVYLHRRGIRITPTYEEVAHLEWHHPRRLLRTTLRVGTLIVGVALILGALAISWLPGPGGIPGILMGLAVLATQFRWARRPFHWIRRAVTNRPEPGELALGDFACPGAAGHPVPDPEPNEREPTPQPRALDQPRAEAVKKPTPPEPARAGS